MFLRNQFSGNGTFEMPKILRDDIPLEKIELVGYDKISNVKDDKIVHFFLDDYKFEVMWNNPLPRIERDYTYPGGGNGVRLFPDGKITPQYYEGDIIYA